MERKIKYLVIAIILVLTLVKLLFLGPIRITEGHEIAQSILATNEFKYWINNGYNFNYQFPIYPFLIAVFYFFRELPEMAIALNLLCSGVTAYFIAKISHALFNKNKWLTIIATIGFLTHPIISYYQVATIHPLALDLLFATLLIYMGICWKHYSLKNSIICGLIIGLALLNRPTLIVFALPIAYRLLTTTSIKPLIFRAVIIGFIAIIPVGMWMIRNHSIYGEWSLNSSYGQNLWIGIQEETEGTAQKANGQTYYSLMDDSTYAAISILNPVEESAYFTKKYQTELEKTPGLWSSMFVLKLKNFWWFRSNIGVDYGPGISDYIIFYKIGYVLLLIFGLLGFIVSNKYWRMVLLSILLLSLFQASFYVETRHRLLIEPALIISSLAAIQYFMLKLFKKA
ncbi:MAG: hypothetical protein ACI9J3_003279 [Parvicellaceae bacterium]|jgi:hypothetical protein